MRRGSSNLFLILGVSLYMIHPGEGFPISRAFGRADDGSPTVFIPDSLEASNQDSSSSPPADSLSGSSPVVDSLDAARGDASVQTADSLFAAPPVADSLDSSDSLETVPPAGAWLSDRERISVLFREPFDASRFPGRVTVLLREEIAATGATTFGELMAWVEGTEIMDGGFLMDEQFLSRGGSGPQEVVFLIDGMRVNEPSTGIMDMRDIALESIYRIEILQGPLAVLVAGEATEAVINVLTSRHPGGKPASRISILDGDGSLTLVQGSFSRELSGNGFMHLTAARSSIDGLAEAVPSKNMQIASRLGFDILGVRVEGWVRRISVDRETDIDNITSTASHNRSTYGLSGTKLLKEDLSLTATVMRTIHRFDGNFDFPIEEDAETGRTAFEVGVFKRFSEDRLLSVGYEWERLRAEFDDGKRDRTLRNSLYLHGLSRAARLFDISFGSRLDLLKGEDGDISAAVSMGYSASEKIKPYFAFSLGGYPPSNRGNSWKVETGTNVGPLNGLTLHLSYSFQDISSRDRKIIYYRIYPDSLTGEFPGSFPSRTSFRSTIRFIPRQGLSFSFGLTRSSNDGSWNSSFPSETILSVRSSLRRRLVSDNLIFEGSALYKRLYEGEVGLLDIRVGVKISDLRLFFSGMNMLDNRYVTLPGFSPDGRYAKWGFSWDFIE